MAGGTPESESSVEEGLEQEHPETRRPSHRDRRTRQKRSEWDAGEKIGFPRWPRTPWNRAAAGFFQMKMGVPRIVLLACAALTAFSSVLPAQTRTGSRKAVQTGDLTGVWYPSSVNTFTFIWTDSQGRRLTTLPLTPWAEEKFKANHPIGG